MSEVTYLVNQVLTKSYCIKVLCRFQMKNKLLWSSSGVDPEYHRSVPSSYLFSFVYMMMKT